MTNNFVDYYDLLQLSPNAEEETIHRVFRHLAKKCHPDLEVGDPERFRLLALAHETLSDQASRAAYDASNQEYWNKKWRVASEASDGSAFAEDQNTREKLLSLLYVQRRRDMRSPGLGEYEMARLLRIPRGTGGSSGTCARRGGSSASRPANWPSAPTAWIR